MGTWDQPVSQGLLLTSKKTTGRKVEGRECGRGCLQLDELGHREILKPGSDLGDLSGLAGS